MLKMLGALLIVLCGAAAGALKAAQLDTQLKYLKDMQLFSQSLINDLNFRQSSSKAALKAAAAQLKALPFKINFNAANIKTELLNAYKDMPREAQNEVFYEALMQYGTAETGIQLKQLEYAAHTLEAMAAQKQLCLDSSKKLCGAMGLFAGIAAAILLI